MSRLRSVLCGLALVACLLSPASAYLGSYNGGSGGSSGTGPVGPAGPAGPTGPAGADGIGGPGYLAGPFYTPFMGPPQGGAVAPQSTTTAFCQAVWFPNISPAGGGTGTLGVIGIRALVAGTTTVQVGVYANDATASPYAPGTFLANTTALANTTTNGLSTTFATGLSISANTLYWFCLEANDVTMTYATSAANTTNYGFTSVVGLSLANSVAGTVSPFNGIVVNATGGYGVWPATLHGVSMTQNQGRTPFFYFQFLSIP